MKGLRTLALCLSLLVAVPTASVIPGCAAFNQRIEDTPRGIYFEVQEAFTASVLIATQRKRSGHISQSAWDSTIYPAILAGNAALDRMEADIAAGNTGNLSGARELLLGIIAIMEGGE